MTQSSAHSPQWRNHAPVISFPPQRRGKMLPLERYLRHQGHRDEDVARAYSEGGYTQSAIAAVLGLPVSCISRVIRAIGVKGKT